MPLGKRRFKASCLESARLAKTKSFGDLGRFLLTFLILAAIRGPLGSANKSALP